jgi:hypothetical protein
MGTESYRRASFNGSLSIMKYPIGQVDFGCIELLSCHPSRLAFIMYHPLGFSWDSVLHQIVNLKLEEYKKNRHSSHVTASNYQKEI